MPSLRNSLNIRSRVMWVRAFFNSYKRRVIAAGGVIQNEPCAVRSLNNNLLRSASWTLVPSGIEEDVVFAQKPTSGLGDLTFTRASDATYTDSTGVVRRSPYNLLTFSEDFNAWNKQQVNVSSNVAANPLTGLVNADLLVPDTTSNNHRIFQTATAPSSNVLSVYAKASGYNYISLGHAGGVNGNGIIFNLSNGTVSGSLVGFSGTISPAGSGWYLCSLIQSAATNDYQSASRWIIVRDNSTNLVFTGDGTSGVLVANAQLVEGTSALDYFPTTNRQDVPRIDFRNADGTLSSCGRLLLEPQRTNSIRNSSMVGAVAGSPGTLPTNYDIANLTGLTRTVVGTGTENGLPYVDLRFNGTSTTSSFEIRFEASTQIAATSGQTWTFSPYVKVIDGTFNSAVIGIIERASGGSFVAVGNAPLTITSTLQRFAYTRTLAGGATVAFAQPLIFFTLTNGAAYDFTIRIAAPQMELGGSATSWIPTTTAAVTRLADTASKTGVSSLIGQTEGTLFMDILPTDLTNQGRYISIESSTGIANGWIGIFAGSSNNFRFYGNNWDFAAGSIVSGTRYKVAMAYKNGVLTSAYINGSSVGTLTANTTGKSYATLKLANAAVGNTGCCDFYNSIIFTTALSNAQLAQLTTL